MRPEEELAALRAENRILRGLVQTNPQWKCPYGYVVKPFETIGHCPAGFPGCACADDRIAILCEDGSRVIEHLQRQLQRLQALIDGAVI